MAKKELENIENGTETKTKSKKERKAALKKAKELEFEAMMAEKKKVDEKIDNLKKDKKSTKDKKTKKKLSKEIKELKYERNKIGRKDTFFGDVREEMHLVRWPNKGEVFKYSIACLIFVAFFALFFFGIDALFALVKGWIG